MVFFLKRIKTLVDSDKIENPEKVAILLKSLCRSHIISLTGCKSNDWIGRVYRIFFYDANPFSGISHHPLLNLRIDFDKTDQAQWRRALFDALRKQRKVALRLGEVIKEGDWSLPPRKIKRILDTKAWIEGLIFDESGQFALQPEQLKKARELQIKWREIDPQDVHLGLRQKGVDMRIGLDIASITLKKQAQTIILVSGDSDFVPAAKLARREGVEFILDPLWQSVRDDLFEHIDGLQSGIKRPTSQKTTPNMLAPDADLED
ncbi:NYN domain-containing protein [Pannonibacter sp.]|uniref:NYN domain-containing protein n=1 Tax=Pannonibacter sp. TaxID=1906786 RepID=UPI003F70A2F8